MVHDGKYIYIKFFEPCSTNKLKIDKKVFWKGDTLELFFSMDKQRPYSQFAIAVDGETRSLAYMNENGVNFSIKTKMATKVLSKVEENSWTVYLAFPLSKLIPNQTLTSGQSIYANFFRNSPSRSATSWSPIFVPVFATLNRMGEIILK
jgi:hypothetical protein